MSMNDNTVLVAEIRRLIEEITALKARIAELEHQHRNDECANRLLLDAIERIKNAP